MSSVGSFNCRSSGGGSTGPALLPTQTPGPVSKVNLVNLDFVNGVSINSISNFSPKTRVYLIMYAKDSTLPRPSFSYYTSLSSQPSTFTAKPSEKNISLHSGQGRSFICGTHLAAGILPVQGIGVSSFKVMQRKDAEGETRNFYVSYYGGDQLIAATCRKIGAYCCVYVQDSEWGKGTMTPSFVEEFQRWFDEIYPQMHAAFGEEQPVGVNGDTKITVLFNSYISQAVYDMFPRNEQNPYSNERKMFYVESSFTDTYSLKMVSVHEFCHLIEAYRKYLSSGRHGDETWLSEGLATAASELMGFPQDVTFWFCEKPYDSLTRWTNSASSSDYYDYAVAGMFARYLIRNYTANLCFNIVNSDKVGIEAVNAALSASGYSDRFPDVFRKWVAANCLYKCNTEGTPYNYPAATYTWTGGGICSLPAIDLQHFEAPPGSPDGR